MRAIGLLLVAGLLVAGTLWYVHGGKVDPSPCAPSQTVGTWTNPFRGQR